MANIDNPSPTAAPATDTIRDTLIGDLMKEMAPHPLYNPTLSPEKEQLLLKLGAFNGEGVADAIKQNFKELDYDHDGRLSTKELSDGLTQSIKDGYRKLSPRLYTAIRAVDLISRFADDGPNQTLTMKDLDVLGKAKSVPEFDWQSVWSVTSDLSSPVGKVVGAGLIAGGAAYLNPIAVGIGVLVEADTFKHGYDRYQQQRQFLNNVLRNPIGIR